MEKIKGHLKQVLGTVFLLILIPVCNIFYDRYQEWEAKRVFIRVDYNMRLEKRGEVGGFEVYQVWDKDEKAGFITLPKK